MYLTTPNTIKAGMANNKRIYSRRPRLIDTRYTQLSLFTENGDAVRFLPDVDIRKVFNAFAYKLESNRKLLYKFALSKTKNTYDAEELVQNTIERALRKYPYEKDGNLTGWLMNTIKWLFYNQCRDKRVEPVNYIGESPEETDGFTEENAAIHNMAFKDAKNMLSFLTDADRKLAEMRYLEGMHYKEIAIDLDMPIGTVKCRLYFIRKILKQQLSEYEG